MLRDRLSRNTLTLLTGNIGSAVLSFVLAALIGRVLNEEGLGVYAAALAWVFPVSLIAEFGLGTLITRDLAESSALERNYLHATVIARMTLGSTLMLGLMLSAPLLSTDDAVIRGIIISAPLVVVNPFYGTFTAIFRAHHHMAPITVLNIGMLVAQVTLTAGVFIVGGDVLDALAVNTLTSTGQLVAAWRYYKIEYRPNSQSQVASTSSLDTTSTLAIMKKAYPFAIAGVLAAINTRIGVIFLERLADTGEVGFYAAVTRIIEGLKLLPYALFGALLPALAALDHMDVLFRRVLLSLAGYGLVTGIALSIMATPLLVFIYGDGFGDASMTLQIAGWALLPAVLRAGQTLYWYARGREQFTNHVTVGIIVLQIMLSLWLIPQYGAAGAAVVLLITESAGFIWMVRR